VGRQSTMDTGEGGANDNLFYGNDFSFAPANGIEATFSRNISSATTSGLRVRDVGGYSFDSGSSVIDSSKTHRQSRSSTGKTTLSSRIFLPTIRPVSGCGETRSHL